MVVQNEPSSLYTSSSSVQGASTSFAISSCDIPGGSNNAGCHIKGDRVLKYQQHFDFGLSEDDVQPMERWSNTFNMRPITLCNLAGEISLRSMASRSHNPRIRSRSVMTASKSLDLLRQNLQAAINKDIDAVIQGYLEKFFCPAVRNIRANLGRSSITSDTMREVACSILEEAKLFYSGGGGRLTGLSYKSEDRTNTQDLLRKRKSNDLHDQHSKRSRLDVSNKVPLSKLDPLRIDAKSLFMLASRAQKVLGLRSSGFSVRLPAELFRYRTDKEDRDWLVGRKLLRSSLSSSNSHATYSSVSSQSRNSSPSDVAVNLVLVEDVKELATLDEYKSNLVLNELRGFQVPEFLLVKVQNYMTELANSRTQVPEFSGLHLGLHTSTSDSSNSSLSNLFETHTRGQQTSTNEWQGSGDPELITRQTTSTVHHIMFQTQNLNDQSFQNMSLDRSSQNMSLDQNSQNMSLDQSSQNMSLDQSSQNMSLDQSSQNMSLDQSSQNMSVPLQTQNAGVSHQSVSTMDSIDENVSQNLQDTMDELTNSLAVQSMPQNMNMSNSANAVLSQQRVCELSNTFESLDDRNMSQSLNSQIQNMSQSLNSQIQNMSQSLNSQDQSMLDSASMHHDLSQLSQSIDSENGNGTQNSSKKEPNVSHGIHSNIGTDTLSQSRDSVSQSVDLASGNGPRSDQLEEMGHCMDSPDHGISLAESHSTLTALLNSQTQQ